VVSSDLVKCSGLAVADRREQLLGLPLELIEVRALRQRASRWAIEHDELLPTGDAAWPTGPVSARSGRKSSSIRSMLYETRMDSVLPADTEALRAPRKSIPNE
jgi:hypothetical protein